MASLARRPLQRMTSDRTDPPQMFHRPSDPPEPSPPIRGSDQIVSLHTEWARVHADPAETPTLSGRLRKSVRSIAWRVSHGADHRLLGDLVRAVDAIAVRCDELSERVVHLEASLDEVARILGSELTQLRADVEKGTRESAGPASSKHER